jgi:hypothetical protein
MKNVHILCKFCFFGGGSSIILSLLVDEVKTLELTTLLGSMIYAGRNRC